MCQLAGLPPVKPYMMNVYRENQRDLQLDRIRFREINYTIIDDDNFVKDKELEWSKNKTKIGVVQEITYQGALCKFKFFSLPFLHQWLRSWNHSQIATRHCAPLRFDLSIFQFFFLQIFILLVVRVKGMRNHFIVHIINGTLLDSIF